MRYLAPRLLSVLIIALCPTGAAGSVEDVPLSSPTATGMGARNLITEAAKLDAGPCRALERIASSVALSRDGNTAAMGAPNANVGSAIAQGVVYLFNRGPEGWALQQRVIVSDTGTGKLREFGYSVALSADGRTLVAGTREANRVYIFTSDGTTWTERQRLDGTMAFGYGVAISADGTYILVGAPKVPLGAGVPGMSYIFARDGGTWRQLQALTASDGTANDTFGNSVALSDDGNTLLIAASRYYVGSYGAQGAVYLFQRGPTGWTQQRKFMASDRAHNGENNDAFGCSISLATDGRTAVIGALNSAGDGVSDGALYIYTKVGDQWNEQSPKVFAGDVTGYLGQSVALSADGTTIIAGAQRTEAAYVFKLYDGTWLEQKKLRTTDVRDGDYFGCAVAIAGDAATVLVGASDAIVDRNLDEGAGYIFTAEGAPLAQKQKLIVEGSAAAANLGSAVAITPDGQTAVVGNWHATVGFNLAQGAVYIFRRDGSGWSKPAKLTSADGIRDAFFGAALAISPDGKTLVVGSHGAHGANTAQGAVYVYESNGSKWNLRQKLTAQDGVSYDGFGCSVSFNEGSLAVGAAYPTGKHGAVYLFRLVGSQWIEQQKVEADDASTEDAFGADVALHGSTLAVNSPNASIGANQYQGAVYLFSYDGTRWVQQQKLTAADGRARDFLGTGLAFTADGQQLVVGASPASVGESYMQGAAYVFGQSGGIWTQRQKLLASDGSESDGFGNSVAISGNKLVIGAREASGAGYSESGAAYIFALSETGWTETAKLIRAVGAYDNLGLCVAIGGDTVLAGAPESWVEKTQGAGAVCVFDLAASPKATVTVSPVSLGIGDVGLVSLVFSRTISNLSLANLVSSCGQLGHLQSFDGGRTWTALLIPPQGSRSSGNTLSLSGTIRDLDGRALIGPAVSNRFAVSTQPVEIDSGVAGSVVVYAKDLTHPNGNGYDQMVLIGSSGALTSRPGKVTRLSYIDLNDDIVQVEFAGAGTLSIALTDFQYPASPRNYVQSVAYMKGHARIAIGGADETTHVSVFTVGRATAFDPTGNYNFLLPISAANDPARNGSPLFVGHEITGYDGIADIGLITIQSRNGKFGSVRTSNAHYFASSGLTGVYAPGVSFVGPVYVGNVDGFDRSCAVLQLGMSSDVRVTGGDLFQDNGQTVEVSGFDRLNFTDGRDSAGRLLPALTNRAVLIREGRDVTAEIVVNPTH